MCWDQTTNNGNTIYTRAYEGISYTVVSDPERILSISVSSGNDFVKYNFNRFGIATATLVSGSPTFVSPKNRLLKPIANIVSSLSSRDLSQRDSLEQCLNSIEA